MNDFYKELASRLPRGTLDTINNYVKKGWRPNGFVEACLAHDLMGVMGRQQHPEFKYAADICMYIHWCIPGGRTVHGSYEIVDRHIDKFKKKEEEEEETE